MNELLVRILSGIIMIAVALSAAFEGGGLFAVFVAAVATVMFYEWRQITRGWAPRWAIGGFVYALVPAVMVLMNVVYAFSAYPAGILSDRIDRLTVLMIGLFLSVARSNNGIARVPFRSDAENLRRLI